jgi:DNA-binding transcriptional LysR family regulator
VERGRGAGPVTLTDAGAVLLAHAGPMLSRLRAARADIAVIADGRTHEVRLGVDPGVGRRVLPAVLGDLAAHPNAPGVLLIETTSDDHRRVLLASGDLDLAVVELPLADDRLASAALLRDRFMVLVPVGSPLTGLGRAPTMDEILAMRTIAPGDSKPRDPAPSGPGLVRGAMPYGTVHALVAAGQGVAVIPELLVDGGERSVVALEIADPPAPRILGLAWHSERQLGAAVQALQAAFRRQCPGLDRRPVGAPG